MMDKFIFKAVDNESIAKNIKVSEVRDGRRDYVAYGEDNLFPQTIYNLFINSSIFSSIVKGMTDYVKGKKITATHKLTEKANEDFDTLEDIISKSIFDFVLYNGFALQIFKDSSGNITQIYNLDFDNCRESLDGEFIIYSKEWQKSSSKNYIKLPKFKDGVNQNNSVFYYKGKDTRQSNTYPLPTYIGAYNDILASVEISKFQLDNVTNGFNASCIISFNSGSVDDDTAKRIEKQFKDKFTGNTGNRILLNFNENAESAVKIERLQSDDFSERYLNVNKDIIKNIFIAFRTQPQLFGFVIEGSLFNHEEYTEAANLYQKTVIYPVQKEITRAFERVLGSDSIIIVPFNLEETDEQNTFNQ